jgi:hypothetical protein
MIHQSYRVGFLFRNTVLSGPGRQTSLEVLVNRNDTTVSCFVGAHSGRRVGCSPSESGRLARFPDALSRIMWPSSDDICSTTVRLTNTLLWSTPIKCLWKSMGKIWCFTSLTMFSTPIPVAVRSKAWVFDRSLAGIRGSNPAGGMDVSFFGQCCALSVTSLRRANHPSICVKPSAVCLSVIAKPRQWGCLGPIGTSNCP